MKTVYDLSTREWTLAGSTPDLWRFFPTRLVCERKDLEVEPLTVRVPGSVQGALREAGVLPDWNVGLQSRQCEWVENRDWIYELVLPAEWLTPGAAVRLVAQGLDYGGEVLLNNKPVGAFRNAFVPHAFDLTPHLETGDHVLRIVFTGAPRWLGQFGQTSRMTDWKPRYNYHWDWTSRLVQIGIWDAITLEVSDGREIAELGARTDFDIEAGGGSLFIRGRASGQAGDCIRLTLSDEASGEVLQSGEISPEAFGEGLVWTGLAVEPWWPNGLGAQPLYTLQCRLLDHEGRELDAASCRVGFKHVDWQPCEGAPAGADPWLCAVNGRPLFLQGVNWTPIRPNFADVTEADYRKRLALYQSLGMNLLRVWGGAFLEKAIFYELCDELGLMVWQEFPLSSSGRDSYPPDTPQAMDELCAIARSYIARRQHHPSLTIWCGGNELLGVMGAGSQMPNGGPPADERHPLLGRLARLVAEEDPGRRFLATSPSGPTFVATEETLGTGRNWDVHGPWMCKDMAAWTDFFAKDDALFRSETGAAGASPVAVIRQYKGDLPELPCSAANPLWRRQPWWVESDEFTQEHGREPRDLEEHVAWSQQRQARALAVVAEACKGRFPRCGGLLIWMGHDSFPCTSNSAIVDFNGDPKPAALTLGEIFRQPAAIQPEPAMARQDD